MKNNKGITLLALVITIVILLILAGITLSVVIGENGLIGKSRDAASETKIAQIDEEISLAWANSMVDRSFADLTLERKAEVFEGKLKEKDSNATVVVSDTDKKELTVNYKGLERIIAAGKNGKANYYSGNTGGNSVNSGSGSTGGNGSAGGNSGENTGGNSGNSGSGNTGGNVDENKATVTFNTMGGSEIASVQVDKGTTVTKPTNPTKSEYEFYNWYYDASCTTVFDFSVPITNDITLYARWLGVSEYLTYRVEDNFEVTITGLSELGIERHNLGALPNLKFPSSFNNMPVTKIASEAFKNKNKIPGITISDSIKTIESNAFDGCSGLTELSIPSTVQLIRYGAFNKCTGLTSVELTCDTLLNSGVFSNCSNISYVKIKPGTTTVMKNSIESNASSGDGNQHSSGQPWFYAKQGVVVEIEDGITRIGNYAFDGAKKIGKLKIPASVTEIGNYTFRGMTQITSQTRTASESDNVLTIPDTVTTIGSYIFQNCSNLESYDVPKAMIDSKSINAGTYYGTKISALANVPVEIETIGNYAFSNCKSIQDLAIPSGVKTIGDYTFSNATNITTLTLGSSLQTIGQCAFEKCTNLTNFAIPSNLQTIGSSAFLECTSLTKLNIPSTVQLIRYNAFNKCSGLTEVEMTCDTLLSSGAFYNCSNIAYVKVKTGTTTVIKNSVEGNASSGESNLHSNGEPWFYAKQGVKVEFEDGITKIGNYSFYKATKVGQIIIPSSVTEIGNYVFYDVSDSLVINYKGTSEQWAAITKGTNNDKLSTVTINYNYSGNSGE